MKQIEKNSGIFIKKMELPELLKLATKKNSKKDLKNVSIHGGSYLNRLKGRGMEFAENRLYQPGDDVRHIDWRVTARSGITHTKLYREERERPVMLVLDLTRSMFFGTQKRLKSVQVAHIAALIGWISLLKGDRVGGVIFSEKTHSEFRPRGDRKHFLRLLSKIMNFHNSIVENMSDHEWIFSNGYHLAKGLRRLRHLVQPGSLVYVFSDFSGFDSECKKHFFQISKQSLVKAYIISDPLEKNLPNFGRYAMSDGKSINWINAVNPETRKKYKYTFEVIKERLVEELRLCKVSPIDLSTADDISKVLEQQ